MAQPVLSSSMCHSPLTRRSIARTLFAVLWLHYITSISYASIFPYYHTDTVPVSSEDSNPSTSSRSAVVDDDDFDIHTFTLLVMATDTAAGINMTGDISTLRSVFADMEDIYKTTLEMQLLIISVPETETDASAQDADINEQCPSDWRLNGLCLLYSKPSDVDRSCLLDPAMTKHRGSTQNKAPADDTGTDTALSKGHANTYAGSYANTTSLKQFFLDTLGFALGRILKPSDLPPTATATAITTTDSFPRTASGRYVVREQQHSHEHTHDDKKLHSQSASGKGGACHRRSAEHLNASYFWSNYVLPQRPLIIKNAFQSPSLGNVLKLLHRHRDTIVGTKLSPSADFEGIDDLSNWEGSPNHDGVGGGTSQHVPEYVYSRLQSPDKVVVRAAHRELTVEAVLAMFAYRRRATLGGGGGGNINSSSSSNSTPAANAYVEYLDMSRTPSLMAMLDELMGHDTITSTTTPSTTPTTAITLPEYAQYFYEIYEQLSRLKESSSSSRAGSGQKRAHASSSEAEEAEEVKPMLWLGDGNTVGKLHFDPFDNLLFQVQGTKRFRLLDPENNERFFEGHMREALLEAVELPRQPLPSSLPHAQHTSANSQRTSSGKTACDEWSNSNQCSVADTARRFAFRKSTLLEATSMVHSPIDIGPSSSSDDSGGSGNTSTSLQYIDCVVRPGETLYVPSFWWHEVRSTPSIEVVDDVQLNLAVNFWFDPVFTKSFPCARCRKKFNTKHYKHILKDLVNRDLV